MPRLGEPPTGVSDGDGRLQLGMSEAREMKHCASNSFSSERCRLNGDSARAVWVAAPVFAHARVGGERYFSVGNSGSEFLVTRRSPCTSLLRAVSIHIILGRAPPRPTSLGLSFHTCLSVHLHFLLLSPSPPSPSPSPSRLSQPSPPSPINVRSL